MIAFIRTGWLRTATVVGALLASGGVAQTAHAQEGASSAPPTIGLLGGFASSKLVVSGEGASVTFDARTGIAGGFSLTQHLDGALAVEVDGLYVQKGFEVANTGQTARLSIDYVEFPALLRYELGASSTAPFLTAGGAVAAKASCTGGVSDGAVTVTAGCGSDVKAFDYGLVFGGGLAIDRLSGSVRYSYGLADVLDDPGAKTRNRVLMVMVEYRLTGN
jgi:hypothetical protein